MESQFIRDCEAAETIKELELALVRHGNFNPESAHDITQGIIKCIQFEDRELAKLIRSYC